MAKALKKLENILPLGRCYADMSGPTTNLAELIDKCVGSSIWVIMNSGKGAYYFAGEASPD
jgi:hypothetical protein